MDTSGKSKFKSKFASTSSGSKFLKTPTNNNNNKTFDSFEGNTNNEGTTTMNDYDDNYDDNDNNNNNNNNNNNDSMINRQQSGIASITSPLSYKQESDGIPNTDFNESDGRDTKILGTMHQLPLQYRWTLWHTAPASKSKDQGWSHNYKQIASFDTVGTFWQLFNNIAPPTMLRSGSSYHLFKGEVEPMWEDKFNKGGGSWTYRFGDFGSKNKGRDRNNKNNNNNEDWTNIINYAWYYTVLNMIGNNFNYNDNICGIVISLRKNGRGKIELWIKNASDRKSTDSIGYEFKQFSGAKKRNSSLQFISHEDNKNGRKNNSYNI